MDHSQQRFSAGFFSASNRSAPNLPTSGAGDAQVASSAEVNGVELSSLEPAPDLPPASQDPLEPAIADEMVAEGESPHPESTASVNSGPTLPQLATPPMAQGSAPAKNWSISSGFWQSAEPSPASQDSPLAPESSPNPESPQNIGASMVLDEGEVTGLEDLTEAALAEPFAMAPDFSLPGPEDVPLLGSESPPMAIAPEPQTAVTAADADTILNQPHAELAQLRAENQQLYEHIAQMEVLLQECQATLELQMMRSQTQESLIERQTQELEETHQALQQTQTEADRILTELEKSGQILQRQGQELIEAQTLAATLQDTLEQTQREVSRYQVVVETLTQELDNSQTRIAHLEDTCGQLQQRSLHQDAAIAQTEANCQELQSRLNRQQRQTLQFRSALERCLDLNLVAELPELDEPLQLSPSPVQPWSLAPQADASNLPPRELQAIGSTSASPPTLAEDAVPPTLEDEPTVYPSIPVPVTASPSISLPPLDEIADADIEESIAEPVEVSPSDIVALLDWTLEDPTTLEKTAPTEAASTEVSLPHASDEGTTAKSPTANSFETETEAIAPENNLPATDTPENNTISESRLANSLDPVESTSPENPSIPEEPSSLKQPLANLLSLGAELLNLQGLETPTPAEPPQVTTDGEPASAPEDLGAEAIALEETPEAILDQVDKTDCVAVPRPPQRTSLASVELPRFSS